MFLRMLQITIMVKISQNHQALRIYTGKISQRNKYLICERMTGKYDFLVRSLIFH